MSSAVIRKSIVVSSNQDELHDTTYPIPQEYQAQIPTVPPILPALGSFLLLKFSTIRTPRFHRLLIFPRLLKPLVWHFYPIESSST